MIVQALCQCLYPSLFSLRLDHVPPWDLSPSPGCPCLIPDVHPPWVCLTPSVCLFPSTRHVNDVHGFASCIFVWCQHVEFVQCPPTSYNWCYHLWCCHAECTSFKSILLPLCTRLLLHIRLSWRSHPSSLALSEVSSFLCVFWGEFFRPLRTVGVVILYKLSSPLTQICDLWYWAI